MILALPRHSVHCICRAAHSSSSLGGLFDFDPEDYYKPTRPPRPPRPNRATFHRPPHPAEESGAGQHHHYPSHHYPVTPRPAVQHYPPHTSRPHPTPQPDKVDFYPGYHPTPPAHPVHNEIAESSQLSSASEIPDLLTLVPSHSVLSLLSLPLSVPPSRLAVTINTQGLILY